MVIALLIAAAGARADVYQCIGATGKMLLTDSVCPPGYRTNLVVSDPQPQAVAAAPQPPAGALPSATASAAAMDRRVLEAEAEADRLRDQLEIERLRSELVRDRLDAIEDHLGALNDPQVVYGGLAVPLLVAPKSRFDAPHGKLHDRRPCRDCGPRFDGKTRDGSPRHGRLRDAKPRIVPRQARRDCGTFGCTPTITHAPWDYPRRAQHRTRP
ncbi:MAG TPA: DUF4124 domain-containing protein [Burkholderiales bacterium]